MHDNRVCHRDIKLENILLDERRKTSLIKITDFGLSKLLDDTTLMMSYVGTPSYIAPEVLKNGMCVAAASGGQSGIWVVLTEKVSCDSAKIEESQKKVNFTKRV